MTKNLRKYHLQTWLALLIVLPAGIIGGRLATQKQPVNDLLQPDTVKALPVIVATKEKDDYSIHIRKSNDSSFQLEWINKNILTVPTATIYKVPAGATDITNGLLIGRIEARGIYRFTFPMTNQPVKLSTGQPINLSGFQLILYDFIHRRVLDTINF
jgi:hypothetical protein